MKSIKMNIKTYRVMGWEPTIGMVAWQYVSAPNRYEAIDMTKKAKNRYVKQYKALKWKATRI